MASGELGPHQAECIPSAANVSFVSSLTALAKMSFIDLLHHVQIRIQPDCLVLIPTLHGTLDQVHQCTTGFRPEKLSRRARI